MSGQVGMSGDRPAADFEGDARPLTHVVVTAAGVPGGSARVVLAAREGLAREVLVERALPLLARARRAADHAADPEARTPISRETWEKLADDIADLIGHSVTDQPPAAELEAVLRDGEPARLTWEQIKTLPGTIVAGLPPEALPLEPAVLATPADDVPCPMAPYAESRESATPTRDEGVHAALPAHDLKMPHQIGRPGMSDADLIDWERGVDSCPPGCPRRIAAEHRCSSCRGPRADPPGLGCQQAGAHRMQARLRGRDIAREEEWVRAIGRDQLARFRESREPAAPVATEIRTPLPAGGIYPCKVHPGTAHLQRPCGCAPVDEDPDARARRLDAERDEAGRAYRAAIYAADEAHRAIGGR